MLLYLLIFLAILKSVSGFQATFFKPKVRSIGATTAIRKLHNGICIQMASQVISDANAAGISQKKKPVKSPESGAAMQIENVNLCIGNNDIISGINWSIMPKERWALVGKNGAGYCCLCVQFISINIDFACSFSML